MNVPLIFNKVFIFFFLVPLRAEASDPSDVVNIKDSFGSPMTFGAAVTSSCVSPAPLPCCSPPLP